MNAALCQLMERHRSRTSAFDGVLDTRVETKTLCLGSGSEWRPFNHFSLFGVETIRLSFPAASVTPDSISVWIKNVSLMFCLPRETRLTLVAVVVGGGVAKGENASLKLSVSVMQSVIDDAFLQRD